MSDTQFSKQLLDRYRNCKAPVTPPECQGQICEYSYTGDGEYIFERYVDHSDRKVYVDAVEFTDEIEFEPWNERPYLGNVTDDMHRIFDGPIGEDR